MATPFSSFTSNCLSIVSLFGFRFKTSHAHFLDRTMVLRKAQLDTTCLLVRFRIEHLLNIHL